MRDKFIAPANALLALIAAFTAALTFYSCTRFYTFLPTSDTWIYTDFLAQAARGHLDTSALFVKHNGVHLIALPKLIYFFDAWLRHGSGALVTAVSLAAMLATVAIFLAVIFRINTINRAEKNFLALLSIILLMSTCQVESLLNPANLQWSLLVFSATLTAWFVYRVAQKKSAANMAGLISGIILSTLTSASVLLILVPLAMLLAGKKWALRIAVVSLCAAALALLVSQIFFHDRFPFAIELFKNWLKFTIDFLAPPVERIHSLVASSVVAVLLCAGLYALAKTKYRAEEKETVFFGFLLWFSLFIILATGVVRSISPDAFTFRFVNLGLLFAAALLPLLFLYVHRQMLLLVIMVYACLLGYVNFTEASSFGFARNHIRLTQVAHALDINDPFVIASMPGTIWEKDDFNYIQANKHRLRDAHTGIYASKEYQQLGKPIDAMGYPAGIACKTNIIKIRRLLPDQASWRLIGESKTEKGESLSRAWFVDNNNIIRGFAIPMEPGKNLLLNLWSDKQWGGFFNLETIQLDNSAIGTAVLQANPAQTALTLYAYSDSEICQGEKITLPDYRDLRKKSARPE